MGGAKSLKPAIIGEDSGKRVPTQNDPLKVYHGVRRTEPGKEICGADAHSRTGSCSTKQLFFAIKEINTYTGESTG